MNQEESSGSYYGILLVNNFSGEEQLEASIQPIPWIEPGPDAYDEYTMFDAYISFAFNNNNGLFIPIGFCDNRYANGADDNYVAYMINRTSLYTNLEWNAYAGWNTNGNTIGTVVSNTILLSLFGSAAGETNALFNSLRILEDLHYQSDIRQQLNNYINQYSNDNNNISNVNETTSNLSPDLNYYINYSYKLLSSRYYNNILNNYNINNWKLNNIYYPWNRTFEIGLCVTTDTTTTC